MTTSFAQSTIYFASNSNDDLIPGAVTANVSGLGASQSIVFSTPVILAVGTVIGLPFQVSRPPPLLYFSTQQAADKITIQSPDGLLISPSTYTPGIGFNGSYFQPSAGGTYLLYFTAGVGYFPNDNVAYVQAVLENTVGQYIDMGSVTYTEDINRLPNPPQVSQIIAANTTSAVPNTFVVDFIKYPVKAGLNILATYRVMVSAAGMEQFGKDYNNTVGANARTVNIVAGQAMAIQWNSTTAGFLNARYAITLSGAGQVALPATVSMTAIPTMYPAMLGNQANITSYSDMAVESITAGVKMDMNPLNDILSTRFSLLSDEVTRLSERNAKAHENIYKILGDVLKHIKTEEDGDRYSVLGHVN